MKYFLFLFLFQIALSQNSTKDFKTVKLENEGEVGQLLIEAGKQQNLDSIIYFANKAKELAVPEEDQGLQAHIYYTLGSTYLYKEQLAKAESNIKKCLVLAKSNNLNNFLRECYSILGIIEGERNNFNGSINYFKKSLQYAKDPQHKVTGKVNIAVVYINNYKYDLAYDILSEVIQMYKGAKDNSLNKDYLAIAYINMATIAPTHTERLQAINKAIKLSEDTTDYDLEVSLLLKKGEILTDNKDYTAAIPVLKESYNEAIKYGNKTIELSSLLALVECSIESNKINEAEDYMDIIVKPEFYQKNANAKVIDSMAYLVYHKAGAYEKSFTHGKRYIKYQDSILNNQIDNAYIEYGKKYQTDLFKKNTEIKDLEITKEKNKNYVISLIALLAIIVVFFTYNNKVKTKNNLILQDKNNTITNQFNIITKANANKQKLFTIISHDLINPFNALLGYSKILKDDYESLDDDSKKKYINIIHNAATSNHVLVKNLLDWSRTQQENITVNKQWCNAHQLLIEASNPYLQVASKKNITIHYPENKEISCFVDKNLMIICLGNLISNAIKFTPLNGEIKLSTHKDDLTFYITITDSGIGLTKEQQENLFVVSRSKSRLGTENEKGTGLGLLICKEIIEMHQGVITVKSEINKGSVVSLGLPIIP